MGKPRDELARLRSWWLQRQGLTPAAAPRSVLACLRVTGWLTTTGSSGVYLSMRARMPGVSREAVDRPAVDGVDMVEVPGAHARPSVLVPRDEAALALRLHAASFDKHVAPQFASGALSEAALKAVAAQVCRALDEGPLSMADIRASMTHLDAPELLVGALIGLAVRGVVRRYALDGRLDSSKYVWELRHPDDRPDLDAEGDFASVVEKATRLFLKRHGPASVEEIAWWGALTKGAVRKALASLGAAPVSVAGWRDDAWLLPEDLRAWNAHDGASAASVVLLPYRDPFVHMRQPPTVLAGHSAVPISKHHTVVAGGDVVGVWEYDPKSEGVVTRLWGADKALRKRVAAVATDTGRFIRQQLGDAKLSAVDPPAQRARRIAFCREGR
jgi:hypothetical protein